MIYFAQPKNGGPIKIGMSERMDLRRKSLSNAGIGGMEIIAEIEGGGAGEYFLHEAFKPIRVQNEFFRSCVPMWRLLLEVSEGGRPAWMPLSIESATKVTESDLTSLFGSLNAAVRCLGYSSRATLKIAMRSIRYRFPGIIAFHKAMQTGALPSYVIDLHGKPSAAEAAA